jgi:hypothetical protein
MRAAFVAMGTIAVAVVAPAGPAAATTDITVTAGLGGSYTPGDRVPVRVTIEADRLVDGTVTVSVTGGVTQRVSVPAEVPGGSVKDLWVLVPTSMGFDEHLTVELREGGDLVADASAALATRSDQDVVAVLPGLSRDLPQTAALALDAGTAKLVAIDEQLLDLGTGALDTAAALAATPGDLGALAPDQLAAITAWVERGGTLLVDAIPGTTVAGLPEGWQPGAAGYARAGAGTIRLTAGALAAGQWNGLLTPGPTKAGNQEGLLTSGLFSSGPIETSLALDAGFRIPKLGWLLAGIALYVLVVGPLTWLVLRSAGHQPMAWIVIPLVAAIFSTAVYVVGGELRRTARAASATIYETGASGTQATTFVLMTSRSGSTVTARFPDHWVAGLDTQSFGFGFALADVDVTAGNDRVDASAHLQPGEFALVRAEGPTDLEGGLEATATSSADGEVHGTVRNTLGVALDDVAVFTGRSRATRVGRLEPGQTAEWTIDNATDFSYEAVAETDVWPSVHQDEFDQFGNPVVGDGPVDAALWSVLNQSRGFNFRTLGSVVAAGWTRSLPSPVNVPGSAVGRSVVISRAEVTATGGRLSDSATRRQLVRGPDVVLPPDNAIGGIFRFVLPPTVDDRPVDVGRLEMDVPGLFANAEWWVDGHWATIPRSGDRTVIGVPPGAIGPVGDIYVRVAIPAVIPGPGREFVLYERQVA